MTKHSPFCYFKPGPGFLDHLAQARGARAKSHWPRTIEQPLVSLAGFLTEKYDKDFPLLKKDFPKWLLWLVGLIVGKTFSRKLISLNMGQKWRANNSKSIEKLGMKYSPLKDSTEEMFQQMIDEGQIAKNSWRCIESHCVQPIRIDLVLGN